jgi:hypothetical protein
MERVNEGGEQLFREREKLRSRRRKPGSKNVKGRKFQKFPRTMEAQILGNSS